MKIKASSDRLSCTQIGDYHFTRMVSDRGTVYYTMWQGDYDNSTGDDYRVTFYPTNSHVFWDNSFGDTKENYRAKY